MKIDPGRGPSESAIKWETAAEAAQRPWTLLPALTCALALVYLLAFSPVFGLALPALVVAILCGLAATASFVRAYGQEYPRKARELTALYRIKCARREEEELENFKDNLEAGFERLEYQAGLEVLAGLAAEYQQNKLALERVRAIEPLSLSLIPALVEETYRRGLGVLSNLLQAVDMLNFPGRRKLEKECYDLEEEIESLAADPLQNERLKFKMESLEFHRQQFNRLRGLKLTTERLLHQARRCEDSLQNTRLELSAVEAGNLKTNVDSVIESLSGTIRQVKEVQSELEKLGY
jgi:hypothetical protein